MSYVRLFICVNTDSLTEDFLDTVGSITRISACQGNNEMCKNPTMRLVSSCKKALFSPQASINFWTKVCENSSVVKNYAVYIFKVVIVLRHSESKEVSAFLQQRGGRKCNKFYVFTKTVVLFFCYH